MNNTNRTNPDPSIYTRYCEHCEKWHIAGASYSCGEKGRFDWPSLEADPLADLAAMVDEIENDVGMKLVQVSEVQAKDAFYQSMQQLYLLGWTSEQVVSFVKSFAEKTQEK